MFFEWWEELLCFIGIIAAIALLVVTGLLKTILVGIGNAILALLNLIFSAIGSLISAIWAPVLIVIGIVLLVFAVKKAVFD